jgi:G3E family GTPase
MIAFTVLGGYLGAGKTTLLNHLLLEWEGHRLGVLVNDFGAINIDASLIDSSSDTQINLTNGCICCTLSDGFAEAIERLVTASQPPEHILVEASGVADVRQLAQYGRAPGMVLDGVLIIADAETLPSKINDKYVADTVRRQLAAGDLILLNKADLVTQAQLDERVSWLRNEYPQANVIPCRYGRLPLDLLLGIRPSRAIAEVPYGEHEHYASWQYQRSTPVSRLQLEAFGQRLDPAVLRAKGTSAEQGGKGFLLQAVGPRREISNIEHAPPGTFLVAIGLRDQLDSLRLDQLAAECFGPSRG